MVVVDDVIRHFIPTSLMGIERRRRTMAASPLAAALAESPGGTLVDWMKCRYGLVPADCEMFLAEITQRSKGGFAIPEQGYRYSEKG